MNLYNEVVGIIELCVRVVDFMIYNYYEFLYVFYVYCYNYCKVGIVMFEYGMCFGREV